VISVELGRRLKAAGVVWAPASGDRFAVPDRDMDDAVFVVSDMVVEVQELPSGRLLKFNGTTEWALDSLQARDAVWLPREDQLRTLLGPTFHSLERVDGGFSVTTRDAGVVHRHHHRDAECAYAEAVLAMVVATAAP